jgi:hypothetical protein
MVHARREADTARMPTRYGARQAERVLLRACDGALDAAALHRQVLGACGG